MKKIFLVLILTMCLSMGMFGVIILNDSESAYNGGGEDEQKSGSNPIGILVVLGAGHFLESHSEFQVILKNVEMAEMSGLDDDELHGILDKAISSMESAKVTYSDLKNLAAGTPYNLEVIEKLKAFDYDGFQKGKGNLNPIVYQEVKGFLSRGDVTGTYSEMFSNTVDILENLYQLKKSIVKDILSDISMLWQLNQKYSNALFFGQYAAMIFKAVE